LRVPSGAEHAVDYTNASAPVLAVRIQELFGWPETPTVASGRMPLVLHLLAPNYRPQQVTRDLRNFWNVTYVEVRKEMRVRYPKHDWPIDPWNAVASRGAKRRPPPS
jgi:ATP-dependent helicase HrpB